MTARRSLLLALAIVVATFAAFASPASAAENPDYTSNPPTERVDPVVSPASVRRAPAAPAVLNSRQTLAITGSDVAGFAVIGTILLGTGAALLLVRRRVAA
ncbi:MAG: LPXTG cell wall anchor domain-containing protein [Acidimicrobiales bacterium]|nr:LPXTG cell wall anchor domain-containing protein [Acidimicrobiales bacterium]